MATASAKTHYWRDKLLRLLFNGGDAIVADGGNVPAWENVSAGFNPGTIANLYVALATADPTDSGSMNTNELAGGGYARQGIQRTSANWGVVNTDPANPYVENLTGLNWGKNTGAPVTVTHIGVGRDLAGAGVPIAFVPLDAPVLIPTGSSFSIGARGIRIFAL